MSKATIEGIADHAVWTLSRTEIEYLADRLYSRGVSVLTAVGPRERDDLVIASRVIVRLLQSYERGTGRQLAAIMLGGQA